MYVLSYSKILTIPPSFEDCKTLEIALMCLKEKYYLQQKKRESEKNNSLDQCGCGRDYSSAVSGKSIRKEQD